MSGRNYRLMPTEHLWQRLDRACERSGISVRQVSLKSGLSSSALGKIIAQKRNNVLLDTVDGVARATGTNYDWLVTGVGAETPYRSPVANFASKQDAATHARSLGVPEWAIEAIMVREFNYPHDPGARHFLRLMMDEADAAEGPRDSGTHPRPSRF